MGEIRNELYQAMEDDRRRASQETVDMFKRLTEYYEFEDAVKWFNLPQPLLANQLPVDLIAAGKADELHRVWDGLDAGAYI